MSDARGRVAQTLAAATRKSACTEHSQLGRAEGVVRSMLVLCAASMQLALNVSLALSTEVQLPTVHVHGCARLCS